MALPYRARLNERTLLNLPGIRGGAYVFTYMEDTSERGLETGPYCEPGCECGCADNFEPRMVVEIASGDDVVNLAFDVDSTLYRANSLHKLDTLIAALRVFRVALIEEFEPYDRRARELARHKGEDVLDEPPDRGSRQAAPIPRHRGRVARRAPAKRVHGSSSLPGVFRRSSDTEPAHGGHRSTASVTSGTRECPWGTLVAGSIGDRA